MKFLRVKSTNRKIFKNETIRVYTGSKLPLGTTSVIIQENAKILKNKHVLLKHKKVKKGEFIRRKGLDFKKNSCIISKGKYLLLET